MYVVTGSSAIKHWLPEWRDPKDFDIFVSQDQGQLTFMNGRRLERYILPDDIMRRLEYKSFQRYMDLNDIYTLKLSHCFWENNLDKTIHDIVKLSDICEYDKDLFHDLKEFWKLKFGGKEFLSLEKSKEDFFDNAIEEVIPHDDLHKIIAKYDKPLYESCLKDGEQVLTSYKKFCELSFQDRIHMIREEIIVIALERFLIPSGFTINHRAAYYKSFKKVLTSLMKGRFADFTAFNMKEILDYNMIQEKEKTECLI